MENYISLSELNSLVKEQIEQNLSGLYYIVAEINEFRENRGHAYLELAEKDEEQGLKAKARAVIWARTYGMLKAYFESSTGHRLKAGLKVLVAVKVVFHEVYGYSLNITDIDPTYTIGEIERRRLLIIKRLEEEGVTDMNKELDFPLVPQRIAVISSETAAGYGDFINQLKKSPFIFKTKLFNASMQGEDTEKSIINAFEKIFEEEDNFDIVVIIRGGGAKSDLSWFDSYDIAVNTAQFPLPVLTGIGHERDKTVTDIVAYESLNTPTAVAEYLTDKVSDFYDYLISLSENFKFYVFDILTRNKELLNNLSNELKFSVSKIISEKNNEINLLQSEYKHIVTAYLKSNENTLDLFPERIKNAVKINFIRKRQTFDFFKIKLNNSLKNFFSDNRHKLNAYEQKANLINPLNILKAGYSYTLTNGKILKSAKEVKKGDIIETILYEGKIRSEVKD